VTRKLPRLVCLALLAAGFVIAPIVSASAAGSSVDVHNPPTGFSNGPGGNRTDIYVHDSVLWLVKEGTHNITPAEDVPNSQRWGQKASDDLTPDSNPFSVVFDKPGKYYYYSTVGGEGADKHGELTGMWGWVNVTDPNATTTTSSTTTTAPPPPATTDTTTHAAAPPATTAPTAPAAAGPSATHAPTTALPAPTTTTAGKAEKDKKPKDETTASTEVAAPPPPVDLPAEAIVPNVTPNGTVTQNGIEAPSSTPEGDAVALIKEKHGRKGVKLLIVTGIGIGALGIGTAGWKFANRSSKYFPA